jgi:UDP-hydrolysing UDP-N-acetyl-D-glucosamine 2-epimerase
LPTRRKHRVCFVTGTRAEHGLMVRTLRAIASHRDLRLQIVATGMHLDRSRGSTWRQIVADGFTIDRKVPWNPGDGSMEDQARATGRAMTALAIAFEEQRSDIVLVVGDRVEAFAAASAGHLSGLAVAHVHGGDRALGQADDTLRHAITKLAHVHFPATAASADRLLRMGEDRWRIHRVGSPGVDGIRADAADRVELAEAGLLFPRRQYVLLVLHPTDPDDARERLRARRLLKAVQDGTGAPVVIIYPNTDPGAAGIAAEWSSLADGPSLRLLRNVPRNLFLGLLREAGVLVGNSSAGILEAASFATPVVNVGPRQQGREHGENVYHCDFDRAAVIATLRRALGDACKPGFSGRNVYGGDGTARRIAATLAGLRLNDRLLRKLIAY